MYVDLYLFVNAKPASSSFFLGGSRSKKVQALDLTTGVWNLDMPDFPGSPRDWPMLVPMGATTALLIGGDEGGWSLFTWASDTAFLDFAANTITAQDDTPCDQIKEGQADR